jgi:hypothetical protein
MKSITKQLIDAAVEARRAELKHKQEIDHMIEWINTKETERKRK